MFQTYCEFQYFSRNDEHKVEYQNYLVSEAFKEKLAGLSYVVEDANTKTEINESISSFSDLMDNICIPLFGKTSNPKPQNSSNKNDFIFNNICSEKRKHFYSKLNDFMKNKTEINRHNMVRARTGYKNAVRKYNFEKDSQKSIKLLNAKYKNATVMMTVRSTTSTSNSRKP